MRARLGRAVAIRPLAWPPDHAVNAQLDPDDAGQLREDDVQPPAIRMQSEPIGKAASSSLTTSVMPPGRIRKRQPSLPCWCRSR